MKYQFGKSHLLFIAVAIVAIAIGFYSQTVNKKEPNAPEFSKLILLPKPKSLGPVEFTDHNNQPFGSAQLQGKWSVLFFGFTHCPDICPTTMQTLKLVKQNLAQAGLWQHYQVVMVSVDPERDTADRLKSYVPFFDPEFIGIAGSIEHTTEFAKNVGILFFKGEQADNGGYTVDHGASLILVDPLGQYAGALTAPHDADQISSDLVALAKYRGAKAEDDSVATRQPGLSGTVAERSVKDEPQPALTFDNAWIRPAPPSANSMAAYFELSNHTDQNIVIVDSQSPIFDMTMIHQTVVVNDMATMEHLDRVVVPAGEKVGFEPQGIHVMLMGPTQALSTGESAELTLIDENGTRYTQRVTVRPAPDE